MVQTMLLFAHLVVALILGKTFFTNLLKNTKQVLFFSVKIVSNENFA